ncbi:unnamed protein product [Dracunculus medinensis]|uniref:Uncharacterized protein n=1 Tax=Dracunculus medinensis TaxID=318479 RepID=A0A0N4UHK4_DRAME|nr:unnamed protein product [Dracunculus medinensis]
MRTCNYYILRFISLTILGIVINDCLISASLNNRNDNKDTNELTTTQWADKIGIKAKQAVKKIGAVMKAEDSILECKGTK